MRAYMGSCSTSEGCHLGLHKGAWTKEEDALLRKCMQKNGDVKWSLVPKLAGLNRCRKSCRLRWLNYLCPNIKRSKFEDAEVDLIIRLHKLLGNRWSLIAGRIPGRTANDIKNYWNTHLSKQSLVNKVGKEANARNVEGLLVNKDGKEANARYVEVVKPKPQCIPCNWRWSKDTEALQDDHHLEESNAPIPASIPALSSTNNATCMYSILSTENLDISIPASSSTIINNASQGNHHQEESNVPMPASSSSNNNATCMDSIFSTENLDVSVPNTEELENLGFENFGSIGDGDFLLEGFKEWDDMYLDHNLWRDFEAI